MIQTLLERINKKTARLRSANVSAATVFLYFSVFMQAHADSNTLEVGTSTIHNTNSNPTFDTFDFVTEFAEIPAVFVLGNTAGPHSCEVRLQNIGLTSFEAICAEDSFWDGGHTNLPLQYMAITEGVKTIPTNNGGSVTFEVGCVDTNAVQHNCMTGCDTESYESISFSAGFGSSPVVIANIQTVANSAIGTPPADPITPMLSVAIDNITASGFDLALDLNKEDDAGTLNNEKICWLAVEQTSQCNLSGTDDTLNLSAIGGPSSVAFEAIITPENIDGWDNGCNNTEEATFTPGCFTSTPVALATKRSRNEPEGWLRYCTLNSGELRITIDEQRVSGQNRQHVDETASVIAFGSAFTTPVSLAYIGTKLKGSRAIDFEWETESESFNIGFNLWAEINGEWQQLNRALIPQINGGFSTPKRYQNRVRLKSSNQRDAITAIGVSSVDNGGYQEFYGPFELGEDYGEETTFEPINWSNVAKEAKQKMQAAGYVSVAGKWRRASRFNKRRAEKEQFQYMRKVVDLTIEPNDFYRVSFEHLSLAGINWANLPISHLALTYLGEPVPRLVLSDDDRFNHGDSIIFYAPPPLGRELLYTTKLNYRLLRNKHKVIDIRSLDFEPPADNLESSNIHLSTQTIGKQQIYSPISPGNDPWFDQSVSAFGTPQSVSYEFDVDEIAPNAFGKVTVDVVGGINFPGIAAQEPDHHVQVSVNGSLVGSKRFDGFVNVLLDYMVPPTLLKPNNNTVTITLPSDTGQQADIVNIDKVSLSVPKTNQLGDHKLLIPAVAGTLRYKIDAQQNSNANSTVFAYQENGNVALIGKLRKSPDGQLYFDAPETDSQDSVLNFAVIPESAYAAPDQINVLKPKKLIKRSGTDYLIIAHPAFIGQDLQRFKEAKEDTGLTVEIVNWLDIVETYGFGMPSPKAITRFLTETSKKTNFRYVLLVGGHSYDYNDYLGNGSISFIPADYATVSQYFHYGPTDALIADINSDGLPDKAIGRWPVRTQDDLKKIIDKTLNWENSKATYQDNVLLVADLSDKAKNHDYRQQLEWVSTAATESQAITRIYLDDYSQTTPETPIANAKMDLLNMFDQNSGGVGLTLFNGHASSSRWTFRNLLNASDINQFSNAGSPTFVLPLACYTTYYETPSVNSLAHQFLFAGQGGAVAISGASYLSEYRENAQFAYRLLNIMRKKKVSIGQAIQLTKSEMKPWNDMVTNWTLLGDPSLRLY